jgi:hypothetical protein
MQVYKFILLSLITSVIVGCSSARHMDNYLQSMKFSEVNGLYQHEQHGLIYQNAEPLKSIMAECSAEVFTGKSFIFGSQTVNDSEVLMQIYLDNVKHMLNSIRMFQAKSQQELININYEILASESGYGAIKHSAFENSKKDSQQLKELSKLMSARNECVKKNGWVFHKKPKS